MNTTVTPPKIGHDFGINTTIIIPKCGLDTDCLLPFDGNTDDTPLNLVEVYPRKGIVHKHIDRGTKVPKAKTSVR